MIRLICSKELCGLFLSLESSTISPVLVSRGKWFKFEGSPPLETETACSERENGMRFVSRLLLFRAVQRGCGLHRNTTDS